MTIHMAMTAALCSFVGALFVLTLEELFGPRGIAFGMFCLVLVIIILGVMR